jgi:hypothetical protein
VVLAVGELDPDGAREGLVAYERDLGDGPEPEDARDDGDHPEPREEPEPGERSPHRPGAGGIARGRRVLVDALGVVHRAKMLPP